MKKGTDGPTRVQTEGRARGYQACKSRGKEGLAAVDSRRLALGVIIAQLRNKIARMPATRMCGQRVAVSPTAQLPSPLRYQSHRCGNHQTERAWRRVALMRNDQPLIETHPVGERVADEVWRIGLVAPATLQRVPRPPSRWRTWLR